MKKFLKVPCWQNQFFLSTANKKCFRINFLLSPFSKHEYIWNQGKMEFTGVMTAAVNQHLRDGRRKIARKPVSCWQHDVTSGYSLMWCQCETSGCRKKKKLSFLCVTSSPSFLPLSLSQLLTSVSTNPKSTPYSELSGSTVIVNVLLIFFKKLTWVCVYKCWNPPWTHLLEKAGYKPNQINQSINQYF